MISYLKLNNFSSSHEVDNQAEGTFVLKTCQRTLLLTLAANQVHDDHNTVNGRDAYLYLLEIICGLQSRLVGENEIVSQFKLAFKEYKRTPHKDNKLILILEKLFKDAKEIRTNYLIGLTQKTYASLTRKHIMTKNQDRVLIIGSGKLAEDLINQFKKKMNVYITARNTEKVQSLAETHGLNMVDWNDKESFSDFPAIVCSIGYNGTLLDEEFFSKWSQKNTRKCFVDLGEPSCIKTHLTKENNLIRLNDILSEGVIQNEYKENQINKARLSMGQLATRRAKLLSSVSKSVETIGN